MIPRELTPEDVLQALDRIARHEIPRERASTKYCLTYSGRHYPPKYVISEACRRFRAGGLPPDEFSGGRPTNTVLTKWGLEIVACHCGGLGFPRQTA